MTELQDLLKQINILHPDQLGGSIQPQDIALLALQNDLQGNILKSHGRNFSVQFFLKFKPERIDDAKAWIRTFAKELITSAAKQREYRQSDQKRIIESLQSKSLKSSNANLYAERMILEQDRKPEPDALFANLFLSFEGYKNLLVCTDEGLKKHFTGSPFIYGMKNENGRVSLKDPPPCQWEEDFSKELHSLLLLADNNCDCLIAHSKEIESKVQEFAEILHIEVGKVFRNENGNTIEHFGFVDGISQPLFFKDDIDNCIHDKWNPSAPLELVLVKDPLNYKEKYSCGSYLVYRKLQQDVSLFNQKVKDLAVELKLVDKRDLEKELNPIEKLDLEAKLSLAEAFVMGRFKDGTPVTLYNKKSASAQDFILNNFDYQGDIQGTRCPFHGHIRKTNPRGDKVKTDDKNQSAKRIARRGISYSYPKEKPSSWSTEEQLKYLQQASIDATEGEVGLLFMCFQADITEQFVTLQKTWANQMHFPKNDTGIDPVIGQGKQIDGGQYWPKNKDGWDENHKGRYDFSKCVQMKGGEYFFAPSISFLIDLPDFTLQDHQCSQSDFKQT
jgi:Dyp-type peroxidase family